MALISIHELSHAFGGPQLLDKVSLQIEKGEKVCLVGRNGQGKTTLMRIISKEINADSGEISYEKNISVTGLTQKLPDNIKGKVFNVIADGLGEIGDILKKYHKLSNLIENNSNEINLKKLDELQQNIESKNGWTLNQKVNTIITKMKLPSNEDFETLSVGMKRRVLLAKALVIEPDVLLLDEPTNHLDIEVIKWLEDFIINSSLTIFFITHDRMFLRKIATRIIELDRGKLHNWNCKYEVYLDRKQSLLESEIQNNIKFDKKLAEEEVWIRKGIRARRTRNEGRVRELMEMRNKRSQRRERVDMAKMNVHLSEKSGKIVSEIEDINFKYDDKYIIKDFSASIIRGDKIGIIGPNGCGKTTLLKIILGELEIEKGKIKLGTKLKISYFDQLRDKLDENKSLKDNIADGNDVIEINGGKKHVIGYLKDFLFSEKRALSPVKTLSGGERNRLLLANLFSKLSNVLVLDEPTNDLDTETLELLEEKLAEYEGTVLIVSHDREFLNNVVTSTFAYEGNAIFKEYVGGFDDWEKRSKFSSLNIEKKKKTSKKFVKPIIKKEKNKLSYMEKRELEQLPDKIDKLEEKRNELETSMSDPEIYSIAGKIKEISEEISIIDKELENFYEKWEKLEEIKSLNE